MTSHPINKKEFLFAKTSKRLPSSQAFHLQAQHSTSCFFLHPLASRTRLEHPRPLHSRSHLEPVTGRAQRDLSQADQRRGPTDKSHQKGSFPRHSDHWGCLRTSDEEM